MNTNIERSHRHHGNNRFVLGAILLVVGILLVLKNLNLIPYPVESIIFSWQMLLIAIGLLSISKRDNFMPGAIMIAIGGFFMLKDYGNVPENFTTLFWGGILIVIGILILVRAFVFKTPSHWNRANEFDADFIDEVNVFGGSEKQINSKNFKGGKITNIFGGSTMDFTEAKLAQGTVVLDVVSIFGGFKMLVPADWVIKIEATSVLGGIADKRQRVGSEQQIGDRILIIKGAAIFGGGEIKNY